MNELRKDELLDAMDLIGENASKDLEVYELFDLALKVIQINDYRKANVISKNGLVPTALEKIAMELTERYD